MKPLISPAAMRAGEKKYFAESGVKSIDVMETAAQALADVILNSSGLNPGAHIYLACGKGSNGGDGLACARLLKDSFRCTVFLTAIPTAPDALENYIRARSCGIPVFTVLPDGQLAGFSAGPTPDKPYPLPVSAGDNPPGSPPDAWVDALLGTGSNRAPEGGVKALIECINRDRATVGDDGHRTLVYSADIPSGLDGQTGKAYEPCVWADYTVTFQYQKTGMALGDGLDACGEIVVADVGFPASAFETFDARLSHPDESLELLEPRPRNIHKGTCGHLLIVAGSFGMAGAAAMCARAALRSGAGLVTIACPSEIIPILQALVPQAMCKPLEYALSEDGHLTSYYSYSISDTIADLLEGKTAVVVGCGLGVPNYLLYEIGNEYSSDKPRSISWQRRDYVRDVCEWSKYYEYHNVVLTLRELLDSDLPIVVDADALNLIARVPVLLSSLKSNHILTPHPGEAQRLLKAKRIAAQYAEKNIYRYYNDLFEEETLPPELISDPLAMSAELSKLGATVLYKGAASIIRDEKDTFISATGCCGMARGGSGDILAGILGALLAAPGKRTIAQNALIASEIHGLAGEYAQARYGSYSMNAADILEFLPEVFPR